MEDGIRRRNIGLRMPFCKDIYLRRQQTIQLFNIHTLQWDPELCKALEIPMSLLPKPRSNSEVYGYLAPGLPGLEDLAGIPVCGL